MRHAWPGAAIKLSVTKFTPIQSPIKTAPAASFIVINLRLRTRLPGAAEQELPRPSKLFSRRRCTAVSTRLILESEECKVDAEQQDPKRNPNPGPVVTRDVQNTRAYYV